METFSVWLQLQEARVGGWDFLFFITLPKQIPLAFYVVGLETCDMDVLNVKTQSQAVIWWGLAL